MIRIIIAEDDVDLREGLEECLSLQGLSVVGVGSALELFQRLAVEEFNIAIIDVGLPDQSGFDIAALLAKRRDMGVIMLTARGTTEDRIRGFSSGADLYFVKPVDCRELAAAIENLSRRVEPTPPGSCAPQAAWVFDRVHWTLRTADVTIDLTSAEIRLLDCILSRPGETMGRLELLTALGYGQDEAGNRNLEAIVRRLRRKIEMEARVKAPIQTVHSRGYLFSAPIAVVSA